ncbi:hypothetical protein BMS3Bbin02_01348 [bacterium BMS3Bbin02]|nr:hypothetical protein BMS3Bbin02_01348 [bacterium BMS3Bbin02]HDH25977.1 hypothetical protein [Actinomycetota bacterium]
MCSLILETGAPSRCGNGIQVVGIGLEAFGETETFFGGPGIRAVEPITVVGVIHDGVVVAISSESS